MLTRTPLLEDALHLEDMRLDDLLGPGAEEEFAPLLRLASRIFHCPMAALSFMDSEQRWWTVQGTCTPQEKRAWETFIFAAHKCIGDDLLLVHQPGTDPRFLACSSTGPAPGSYVGITVRTRKGSRLGLLSLVRHEADLLPDEGVENLRLLATEFGRMLEGRMKNNRIRRSAEEQLEADRVLLQKTLKEQEEERLSISTELHEDIAQTLASTRFFLELAGEGGTGSAELIRKSRETLTKTIQQIRNLSVTITPTTLDDHNLRDLIGDLLESYRERKGLQVRFRFEGDETVDKARAMGLYRILEDLLKWMVDERHQSLVNVRILVCQSVHLSVQIEEAADLLPMTSKVQTRAHSLGAAMTAARHRDGWEWIITAPQAAALPTSR